MEFYLDREIGALWLGSLVQRQNYSLHPRPSCAFFALTEQKLLKMAAEKLGMRFPAASNPISSEEIFRFAYEQGWHFAYYNTDISLVAPVSVV